MKAKKLNKNRWVIRLDKKEEIVRALTDFCKKETIDGGFFFGLGAVDWVQLRHYDEIKKKYSNKTIKDSFEVLNITGSIGREKEIIVHAHICLANAKMQSFGGHLSAARVSGTMEIYLFQEKILRKKFDPKTGLKLFDL